MPAAKQPQPRFKTIQTLPLDWAPIKITQYESLRTGMRVAVVDQKGPKVEGYFALATEIHDDSGAPHTLEHLCFMGSKSYKYKGLLDRLSCRAFSYTNAYTDIDHTCYELKSAGWEGFAQILPPYLEHVILPTLTDAGCYTEVHHVDGTGNDAGVVYAEMQGCENSSAEIMTRRAREMLYPADSGFRSETGGMTKELRTLTADRIRAFHKEMYQPKNLRVVITGELDHDELLHILDEFESTIESEVPNLDDPFKRPWLESAPNVPLTETKIETVQFPEDDESTGEVMIGYMGPSATDELATSALAVLLSYTCGSSISVLEHTLVETEQLCSAVYYSTDTRPDLAIWFSLSNVETEKLHQVYERFLAILRETVSKPLDVSYMSDCLQRFTRQIKQQAESGGQFFTTPIVEDHLYGHRDGHNLASFASLRELDTLGDWSETQWRDFLRKWIVDAKHVVVIGEPSKTLADKIDADEKARVKAQQERLGAEGMKKLAEKLKAAQEENDRPIPDELLQKFAQPSTGSVHFIPTVTARAGAARQMGSLENPIQKIIDKADDGSPLFIHFEHIPSNFVRIRILFGTASVPTHLKPLLPLYLANLLTTPVMLDGKRIEFEELVTTLERETTVYGADIASGNGEMLSLGLAFEPTAYPTIVSRLRTILFDAIHDPGRLLASLTKILAEIPEYKRDGESMLFACNDLVHFTRPAVRYATNILVRAKYLKHVRSTLRRDPDKVLADLGVFCKALHRPENFRVYVAGDLEKLADPVTSWQRFTTGLDLTKALEPLDEPRAGLSPIGKHPGSQTNPPPPANPTASDKPLSNTAFIIPIPSIDTSYALLTASGPDSPNHPDYPALLLAQAFLFATEGPLWVAVRGPGLAYGVSGTKSTTLASVGLLIYKSPDAAKALATCARVVRSYAAGDNAMGVLELESAVSEIVYGLASEQATMAAAADASFAMQVLRGLGADHQKRLLAQVEQLVVEEGGAEKIREVMRKYLLPLFDPASANLVVTCARGLVERCRVGFEAVGFEGVRVRGLEEWGDGYGLSGGGEEDEEDEDEDEDDYEEEDEDEDDEDDEEGDE